MTLTWRLVVSYILIILVTLTLAFATLIVVARPLQNRVARVRLTAQSRQAALQINSLYRQGESTEAILARLGAWDSPDGVQLLFLDPAGTVLADSRGAWPGRRLTVPAGAGRGTVFETLEDADEGEFQLAFTPLGPAANRAGYVAAVAPRLPALAGVVAELGWGFLAAGLVALLVALPLGIFIARSIALPLQGIARAAAVAAAGDYQARLQAAGPPEVRRVAASFNVMIDRVEKSQQAMRDFVSNVSHELKTPLTSIRGFSQAIMEGATPDEAARQRAAGIIYQEAGRMARLVEDLLDLARIDSGQMVMGKTPLNLAEILQNTLDRLLPQAAAKGVEVVQAWETLPAVVGDGDRLAQVFTNLLDNALRHTPAGGRVTLTGKIAKNLPRPRRVRAGLVQADVTTVLSERGDFVEVGIADTGPGIPAEDLPRIFERFYQVDKSRKRGRGTGLGLAITREILEAHGGTVRAENGSNGGTRFTVILPVGEADVLTLVSRR